MSMFTQPPSGGGFFKPAEAENHLVLILRVHGFDKHFDTMKGAEIDRATVDLADLDGGGQVRERVWLTHPGLVNKVSTSGPVLGRIGKVQASKGLAWSLIPYTEGVDDKRAEQWLAANPAVQTAPTGATAPAPAPAAAPQQPPAATHVPPTAAGNPWDALSDEQKRAAQAAYTASRQTFDAPPF